MKTNKKHFYQNTANFYHNRFRTFMISNHKQRHSNFAIAKTSHEHIVERSGFTIAELSLAIAFISVLLITIAVLIVHISGTFQKGLSIKSVNTMGQSLSDNLSRTIAASKGSNYVEKDKYYKQWILDKSIKITNTSGSNSSTNGDVKIPVGGEFTTGEYTYIWNTGYVLDENNNIYKDESGKDLSEYKAKVIDVSAGNKSYDNFRLLRVKGTHHPISDGPTNRVYKVDSAPVELLVASETALAIYDFQLFNAAYNPNTQHAYVSGSFILGTVNGGIDITTNTNFCTDIPSGIATDFNYCAINKFSFGSRTGVGRKGPSS